MKPQEFSSIITKLTKFKIKLDQNNITGKVAETILKIYLSELTSKINTNLLQGV